MAQQKGTVRSLKCLLVLGLLSAFSLAAMSPLFGVHVWYDSHERDHMLFGALEFKAIFESGQWYPRWSPRFMAGFGYPRFAIYQPGVYYFLLPFLYLPLKEVQAFTLAIFCMSMIGALGAYRLARHYGRDRFISCLTGGIYLFMPYAYINLFIREDLSEFFAMMLLPWVMFGLARIQRKASEPLRGKTLLAYVLPLTAVYYAHPAVAIFTTLIIAWFAAVDWIADGIRSRSAWALVLGGLMAAALAAPYWVPIAQLLSDVHLENAAVPVIQGMSWGEIFYRTDADAYPWWIPSLGVLSLFTLGMAFAGLLLAWPDRLFWQVLPPLLISVFMNTEDALPLWHAIPGSNVIQFAWRIVSVSGILQLLGILHLPKLRGRLSQGDYYIAATAVLLAAILFQPSVQEERDRFALRAFSYNRYLVRLQEIPILRFQYPFTSLEDSYTENNEYSPKWADYVALGCLWHNDQDPVTVSDAGMRVQVDKSLLPFRIRGSVDIDAAAGALSTINLNQVYFPGWAVAVGGQRLEVSMDAHHVETAHPFARMDALGRIEIVFPKPGHYAFDGHYDGPPYWLARNLLMVAAMMALWLAGIRFGLVRRA